MRAQCSSVSRVNEPYSDPELIRLMAEAKKLDQELADLSPTANASLVGSEERRRFRELGALSEEAWRRVGAHVTAMRSVTDDLRKPLPEDEG